MGNRVQRVRTEVSEPQMAQAIIEGWKAMFGDVPSKEQVALVLAQNALETGSRKSMWNYNVGNITTSATAGYDYFDDLKTDEQVKPGVWKPMKLKYRAYKSLIDGVKDYLKLLSSKKYSNAWEHIKNPDPAAFSKALKHNGYYTANEAPYTKTLSSLFNRYTKSNSYEVAGSGKVDSAKDLAMSPSQIAQAPQQESNGLMGTLTKFLQQIIASEKRHKKLYKQFLPTHNLVISVKADYTDAIEFSRILCTALDEELMADSFTHGDDSNVEVQCEIQGPAQDCFNAVQQLSQSVAAAFKNATIKVGGIEIKTNVSMNKKSSYQEINVKTATTQYRKFLLKFV